MDVSHIQKSKFCCNHTIQRLENGGFEVTRYIHSYYTLCGQFFEQGMQMNVIRLFFKGKGLSIVQEGCKCWNDVRALFVDSSFPAENRGKTIHVLG